jgi:hypothetical protein
MLLVKCDASAAVRKNIKKRGILIALTVLILLSLLILSWPFLGFLLGMTLQVREAEKKLNAISPARLERIYKDAIRLGSQPDSDGMWYLNDKKFPQEFDDLKPTWLGIGKDGVTIEFSGGIDHRGIVVRQEEGGNWKLFRYNEKKEVTIPMGVKDPSP